MKGYTFALLVCFTLWIQKGTALHCYQCDSNTDPDCQEYFDHGNKNEMDLVSTECEVDAAKYCIKTTGVWGGVVGTTRFCSSRDMSNQCQYIRYPDHDRVYRACIYTCGGSHCNTARRLPILGFTALSILALASLVLRRIL